MNMDLMDRNGDVDRWLDTTLAEFGRTEPRAGLEGRVWASLQAERNRLAVRRRWWWAAGVATAAVALAILWMGGIGSHKELATDSTVAHQKSAETSLPPVRQPSATQKKQIANPALGERRARKMPIARAPRLAQFPASRAMSRDERGLMQVLQSSASRTLLINPDDERALRDLQISNLETPELEVTDLRVSTKEERKTR
jgi:hypothetical protein